MSITKGAMLISNANAVGTELVDQLGGTGYKPVEWADKINLLGINSVDAPYAIKSIQAGTYTGEERGAIQYSNCNAVGSMLNKKLNTNRGFKPVEWPSAIKVLKALAENTVTGDICNVSDGADRVPLKSWSVNIPANLSGKSTVVCNQGGKNLLLPYNADSEEITVNGIKRSYSLDDQEFTFVGTNTKTDTSWLIFSINASDFVLNGLKSGVTYRFSHNLSDDMYAQITYNKSGGGIGAMGYLRGNAGQNASVSFTLPSDFSSLKQFQIGVSSTATYVNITAHFQIEVGSTTTDYTPYVAPTVNTVDLGRTVYGADVDVVGGSGTNGYALFTKNTADMNNSESYPGWKDQGVRTICGGGLNQEYEDGVTSSGNGYGINTLGSSNDILYLPKSMHNNMTQTDWIALAIDITFVIPLAIPEPFTFDPITPTPETNTSVNFWNDTGSNTITYYQAPTALTRSTVSGSIASFSDADTRLTCVNAIATIPPSISGVDTVQLVDAGVNLWEFGDVELNVTQGYVIKYLTTPLPAGNYVISTELTSTTNKCQLRFRKNDGSAIIQITFDANIGRTSVSFNLPETAYRIYVYAGLQQPGYVTTWSNVQLEPGSTATAYTPYVAPTTYTANLPSTNYGGSVDFVNGVDQKTGNKYDLGELTWVADANRTAVFYTTSISGVKTENCALICDSYIVDNSKNANTIVSGEMCSRASYGTNRIFIKDDNFTGYTGTQVQTALSGKYAILELATPTTASITGQAIIPKTGTNNCYNNVGGNTEITYFTNT